MVDETCGCCEGVEKLTPVKMANRPGLPALAYRAGTHAAFLETMIARLVSMTITSTAPSLDPAAEQSGPLHPLQPLSTRDANDPAIALLDSWATVADVLTFYQERIANEGYLRTATERRSVLELARLVGYALRPGVASTVYLALTLDAGYKVTIESGQLRAQSVPGPGELPQSFENTEKLEARADWNVLKPRLAQPQSKASILGTANNPPANPRIYLKGITTNLRVNDPLLVDFGDQAPLALRVVDVKPNAEADHTLVALRTWDENMLARRQEVSIGSSAMALVGAESPNDQLQSFANRYRQAEADRFGVSRETRMYRSVAETLIALQAHAGTETSVPALLAYARQTVLPQLTAELQTAEENDYSRLREWLGTMAAELESLLDRAATVRAEMMALDFALPAAADGAQPRKAEDFSSVISGLTKPASVPPRNTLYLPRRTDAIFQARSDTGLQIVKALRPEVGANLQVAVANTNVTGNNPIRVYAPRVRAPIYAHNAPLRLIYDERGRVSGSEEWPLFGARELQVELLMGYQDGAPDFVTLSLQDGSANYSTRLVPNRESEVKGTLGPFTIRLSQKVNLFDAEEDQKFEVEVLHGDLLFRRFVYSSLEFQVISIQMMTPNGTDGHTVSLGQKQRLASLGDRIALSYVLDPEFNAQHIVSITDETLLPPNPENILAMDAQYDQILPGSWVAILRPEMNVPIVARALRVDTVSKTDYNFPARVTQLTLECLPATEPCWLKDTDLLLSAIRGTTVYAQSEELELAQEVIDTPICSKKEEKDGEADKDVGEDKGAQEGWIELDGLYADLKAGRWLIVTGERTDVTDANGAAVRGVKSSELVMLSEVAYDVENAPAADGGGNGQNGAVAYYGQKEVLRGDRMHTYIKLAATLEYCYRRDNVTIYANVVKASHGETRNEVLGSGDGSKALQSFTLRQPPLTFVASPTPEGAESTLKVYVNDVQWREARTFTGLARTDRRFITRTDDEGKTTVIFGNGSEGARLPTGMENVKAVYRNGIGKPGNVQAEQISMLVTRPLGIKGVVNPLRSSGGADKEDRDQARRNVPITVTSLDRLLSVQDYADFARTFAGIGKAVARRLSDGRRELVHVTIAGADDIPIDKQSDLYRNLVAALRKYGDPDQPLQVDLRELKLLVISAKIRIGPDYLWDSVVTNVRTRLENVFSFAQRDLGQDVTLSEVISTIQSVQGVTYVDVDLLRGIPERTVDPQAPGGRRLLTPDEITAEIRRPLANEPRPRVPVNLADKEFVPASDESDKGKYVIRPAELAFLTPIVQDTLILNRI